MTNDLREELRQQKPFDSLEQEAFLSIGRTEAELGDAFERALRPFGISPTQYNVLRILRGAGPDGLCRNEIRDRLLSRMPDVTRLLDRMEDAGLVTRVRSDVDRRLVSTRLTDRGRALVDGLDQPVADEHARQLGHLSAVQLRTLIELLALARTHD
jgi:DNA-binding MarR family transcriptional regulator